MKGKKFLIIFLVSLVVLAGIIIFLKQTNLKKNNRNTIPSKLPTNEVLMGEAINGTKVEFAISQTRPIAVMIENHPDSRPQSGLLEADIIYETLAEGGITRFLALFQSKEAKSIGPVRSAREYFAQIADEWGAVYAHVGGSNEVISQIKQGKYWNLSDANEYFNEDFFPRPKDKTAPHNIFTSTELLKKLIETHKFSNIAGFEPWLFKDDWPIDSGQIAVRNINIDFSRPGYEVEYRYDISINSYLRFVSREAHIDEASKAQLTAKNIVVQLVKVVPVPNDPLLQVDIKLEGEGRAIYFMDGKAIEGKWKKTAGSRTRYYDLEGNEIKFNRGTIWIELVPTEKEKDLLWK